MTNHDKIIQGKQLIETLSQITRELSDIEIRDLFGNGSIDILLKAILDSDEVQNFPTFAEFFLANKQRASLLAGIRFAITHNYSFKTSKGGKTAFISPTNTQWFEDGVIVLEGDQPFAGLIALYRNGKLSYAVSTRDAGPGEEMGPEDFEFIDIDELLTRSDLFPQEQISKLEEPSTKLQTLIDASNNDEAKYQKLLEIYPWVLGAQHKKIQRHENLDDRNIPDFTGVRVRDGYRDIFELKPPLMRVFRNDGNFTSEFNDAWNQTERYLNFANEEKDYLERRGMKFDNPKCFLILGWNFSQEEIQKIRIKERLNPAIQLVTYNDLFAFMKWTAEFIRVRKGEDASTENSL